MPGGRLYSILRHALDLLIWGGELQSDVPLPPPNAAVFVANHAAALGPIAYNPFNDARRERGRIAHLLERIIAAMLSDPAEPIAARVHGTSGTG